MRAVSPREGHIYARGASRHAGTTALLPYVNYSSEAHMSHLYLIRHAATKPDRQKAAEHWLLSKAGIFEAELFARRRFWSQVDRVITSHTQKAIHTAAPAVELWRLPCEARSVFNEVQRGHYLKHYEKRVRLFFEQPNSSSDEWEMAAAAQTRAIRALESVLDDYPNENMALVGHGLLWMLLRAHLLNQSQISLAEWRAIRMPDVASWKYEKGIWTLLQDFEGIIQIGSG